MSFLANINEIVPAIRQI